MGSKNWTARMEFNELPVPSVARRIQEEEEVAEGVEAVVDEHRHAILRGLSRVMLFGVCPLVIYVVIREIARTGGGIVLWGFALSAMLATAATSLERFALSFRGKVLTYSMTSVALLGVLQLGPLLGIAFTFVAAVLLATLLMGTRHAYGVATLLSLGLCLFTFAAWRGLYGFAPEVNPTTHQWIRISISSLIGLHFFAFAFVRVQAGLSASLAQQIRLRLREQRFVEEREKMVRSAGSVQRLESLGRLAGGIAHDFNNSLVVIQCGLGALEEEISLEERQEVMSEVHDGVNRAAGTARQLLSFAKRNVEEIGVCDAKEVAERLVKEAGRLFPANVTMKLELSGSAQVPAVGLSETAVEQILLTLISNAREALGEQAGQVTIQLGEHRLTGGLSLRVADTGPGISSELRDQVWEPFFTTKGEAHMGLGLSTLWATVRRHGGSVELNSEEGVGTSVSMVFPKAALETRAPEKRRRESGVSRPRERTVLILEDELPIRTALRRVLKHSGLEVVEAGTVSEARAALQGRRFALLISDGVLPDGGVGKFIQDFRQKQRSPVILCSGYLEEDLALEGVSKGECSFLPKPFSPEELTDLVESLLTQEVSSD